MTCDHEPINLDKTYDPNLVEDKWYQFWEEHNCFAGRTDSDRPPFSMVIPPPNITGSLHMGHALNNTLQDILARYRRLKGDNVLWMPGTDHAGIATQNVVERQLHAEGLDRHQVGREKFIERVWKWRQESGSTILNQLRRLGASCDWKRERFTMDEGLSKAVREVFVTLYEEGLIYQGDYITNWCPRCHTALSDLEVEYEEHEGSLWELKYPLADGSGEIIVATTRPETMLGDTAVAVNPDDERYRNLIGSEVILPLMNRRIPIIADAYVDKEFGSGAVKITPAHDPNDFDIGQRHNLPSIKIMDENGKMNENAGVYQGMTREECRTRVVEDLQAQGLLQQIVAYGHNVGHCYRCRCVIEPYLSNQWFVKIKPLAKEAIAAVRDGRTKIIPASWEKTYFNWMENIRDWCISRQIWWGHRIPAWYCQECHEIIVSRTDPDHCPRCQSTNLEQETDVLDTWFSSGLWPFSTMGWPEKTRELEIFYPTSVLVTGFDILFFWVARMMMMGHDRMQKPHQGGKGIKEYRLGGGPALLVIILEQVRFNQFQVPVAEFMPGKLVNGLGCFVETILGKGFIHRHNGFLEPVEDPVVSQRIISRVNPGVRLKTVQVHESETGRVPDFVAEIAVAADPGFGHADVPPLGGEGGKGKTQGVGAVLVDHDQGIDHIPL